MKQIYCYMVLGVGLLLAIFMTTERVYATLGESAESVVTDRRALSATRGATTVRDSYTVHEVQSGSVAVREYVSASGVVFGIAWKGLVHPDLTQLLGPYFNDYQEALQKTTRKQGHRRLLVKTNKVVVEKWGHIRNLQGRAYAPDLIPGGVTVNEIK